MASPILATKLYVPSPRPKAVSRPRLIERLNEGLHGKLILISAPAGFGKTTLVSEWIEKIERPTAWLSLDERDNDFTRFLSYLVAALRTIAPNFGEGVLGALQSPLPPPAETMLTALLNEMASVTGDFILVLDDYHVINAKSVDDALTFVLEHLPPQMHLIITTRDDPQLPVARLRARGQLTELRATDLRFTPSEATDFLNQVMQLGLSMADIATLETRTEGWIAGLQLAALSMRNHRDISEFIGAFAGDNHYIVDYLVEEVLNHQPEPVRNFLLQTAILDRLNGPLCDAVTGQQESSTRLEALNRGNFFVVPLDDRHHWYRYHQLFADVLYTHLMAEQPDQVAALHYRASEWYEHQGSASDAIHHALAARDFARTASLIELAMPALRRSRQEALVLGWLRALPVELFRCRPVLSVHYAGVLLQSGKLEGVEARLRDAERWLEPKVDKGTQRESASAEMVVLDEGEFRGLAGSIAMYRAASALALGDLLATMKYARQVPDVVSEDDHLRRAAAAGLLGIAYWTNADLEAAQRSYVDCMARLQRIGHLSDAIGCAIALADIRIVQGRLHEAMRTYEYFLALAKEQGTPVPRGTADMYVGMSDLYREHHDLNTATQLLLRSRELGEFAGLPQNPYRWCVAMARIREVEGDLNGALDLLHEAESRYAGDFSPNVRPVAALRTRLWIAQGRLGEAQSWAHERGLSIENEMSYLREFEHITLARVLLSRYRSEGADHALLDAIQFLDRLLKAAEEGGRTGSVIEILVLQALARQAHGDIPAALIALERALTLSEPEGYIRVFVDEGSSMAVLLEKAAKHGISPRYAHQLLTAFGKTEDRPPVSHALIDPLSERELEVLRLLGTDLDGPDIARQLTVSLNTIRTHTKNIYTKLGVNNRRAAVRRAEELGLL